MLLAQLLGQIELTTIAAAAGSKNADAVARDLGTVAPGRLSAIMSATRRAPQASHLVTTASLADRSLKTGRKRNPEDALRDLVLELAAPAPGGSSHSSG